MTADGSAGESADSETTVAGGNPGTGSAEERVEGGEANGTGSRSAREDSAETTREQVEESRHTRLDRVATPGGRNSLRHWREARGAIRTTVNFIVVWMVRYSPSLKLKVWLMRRLGADIGDGVSFALTATPDVFWPELVTVHEDAIVGYDATLLCHEFLQDEYRTGEVVVGERAMIGAGAIVLPGVEIGADARVGANAVVTSDVPPGVTVTGAPARPVEAEE